jgi:hypothetical protein
MRFVITSSYEAVAEMGINLGSGNMAVPQHFLNQAEVSPTPQKVGGKAMTQGVGAYLLKPSSFSIAF